MNSQLPNIGGILKAWVVLSENVVSVTTEEIVFINSTINWLPIKFISEDAGFKLSKKDSFDGELFEVAINMKIGKVHNDTDTELDAYINKYCIIGIKDGNGAFRVFGTPSQPLYLGETAQSGNRATDLNHYVINTSAQVTERPIYTTEALFA